MRNFVKIFLLCTLIPAIFYIISKGYDKIFYTRCLLLFALACVLMIIGTPIVRKLAIKFKILDYPNERKIHKNPTPLLGGLAIVSACAIVILINFQYSLEMKGVIFGSGLLFFLGLVDDIKPIPATIKLIIQFIACGILTFCRVTISFLPETFLGKVGEFFITFIWIIWITNAVNFFDGLDGLAAGLVAITSLFFLIIAIQTYQPYLGFFAATIIGACVGFLVYNFYPASIFLGDSGSSFLGFSLGALAVMGEWSSRGPAIALSVPLIVLGIFIFDMLYITISRIIRKKTKTIKEILEYTGKDHLHHRLLEIGLSYRQSIFFIFLLNGCMGLSGVVLRTTLHPLNVSLIIIQACLIFSLLTFIMTVKKSKL